MVVYRIVGYHWVSLGKLYGIVVYSMVIIALIRAYYIKKVDFLKIKSKIFLAFY